MALYCSSAIEDEISSLIYAPHERTKGNRRATAAAATPLPAAAIVAASPAAANADVTIAAAAAAAAVVATNDDDDNSTRNRGKLSLSLSFSPSLSGLSTDTLMNISIQDWEMADMSLLLDPPQFSFVKGEKNKLGAFLRFNAAKRIFHCLQ